jgi:hypothetical protein
MKSEVVRNALLRTAAVLCALAAVIAAWRGDAGEGAAMGAVALVFAVIAVVVQRRQAGSQRP